MKKNFERRELKYPMSASQCKKLKERLSPHLTIDEHGLHTILSLYFDSPDYQLIQKSIDKPYYKEKFRIRSYGEASPTSPVFLEIKKKVGKTIYKRRTSVSYGSLGDHSFHDRTSQIGREIEFLFDRYVLEPKVLIAYDRLAYIYNENPDFRVTLDFGIRYRLTHLNLASSWGKPVSPDVFCLMEVKALGAYPLWFSHLLSDLSITRGHYSKYAQVYEHHILKSDQISPLLTHPHSSRKEKAYA